jgi:3-phenylpropionate/cinnamic acid dioxygenase small subunit
MMLDKDKIHRVIQNPLINFVYDEVYHRVWNFTLYKFNMDKTDSFYPAIHNKVKQYKF